MLRWRPGDRVKVRSADQIQLYKGWSIHENPWYQQWAGKVVTIG